MASEGRSDKAVLEAVETVSLGAPVGVPAEVGG